MSLNYASRTVFVRASMARTLARRPSLLPLAPRHLSSVSPPSKGVFGRMQDSLAERFKKQQTEKFAKHIQALSETETFTIQKFADDMKDSISGWRNNIPFLSDTQQLRTAKATLNAVKIIIEEVGPTITSKEFDNLGRVEKLKLSLKSGTSVEDLNILSRQFQAMDIMHQVLRYRKREGKPIPTDEAGMRKALQEDAANAISKEQKKKMKENQRKRRR